MAVNIINRSNQVNQNPIGTQGNQNSTAIVRGAGESVISVNARDLSLNTGQTISGQVVDLNGNEVKLLLDNNQTINARLEGKFDAKPGQILSFEVSSNEGGHAALRPLYTNLSHSTAILDALKSAGLPNTEQNARMVSAMMDEGMPINKGALWDMSKNIYSFPNANPETVVQLAKLSLPITELSINGLENYKNFEHQVRNDVLSLSNNVVDLMDEALRDANPLVYEAMDESGIKEATTSLTQKANDLLSAFISAVSTGEKNSDVIKDMGSEVGLDAMTESDAGEVVTNASELNNTIHFNNEGLDLAGKVLDMLELSDQNESIQKNISDPEILKLLDELTKEDKITSDIIGDESDNADVLATEQENIEKQSQIDISSDENLREYSHSFKDILDIAKNMISDIQHGADISPEKKQALSKLLSNDVFKNDLKDSLSKQLFLKPDQVTDKNKIEDLYSKILKQANQAMEILNDSGKNNPAMEKAVQNLTDNVNFMNELNQAVTYVQIPLLMNNQSAHGDLYVYTNKKKLLEKDGNLTALLHLDMDNLGPMDIHIALTNGTKVKTNFILQDEATIDFIESHIDLLNERLIKKGYDMSTSVSKKEKNGATSIVDEFLKDTPEAKKNVSPIKYSFDVRA